MEASGIPFRRYNDNSLKMLFNPPLPRPVNFSPISCLPPELISLIIRQSLPSHSTSTSFQRLPILLGFSTISSLFEQESKRLIFRYLWLSNGGENLISVLKGLKGFEEKEWVSNTSRVKFIELSQDSTSSTSDPIRERVLNIVESCHNLEEISLYKSDETLLRALSKLSNLSALNIHGHSVDSSTFVFNVLLPLRPIRFNTVTHLSLCHWSDTSTFGSFLQSSNFPLLNSLKLTHVDLTTSEFLSGSSEFGSRLHYLELVDCTGGEQFLITCQQLKALNFNSDSNFPNILQDYFPKTLKSCYLPTLRFYWLVQKFEKSLDLKPQMITSAKGSKHHLTIAERSFLSNWCKLKNVDWKEEGGTNRWEELRRTGY